MNERQDDLAFTLDKVVPWGRSFDEYRRMFSLADADLRLRILGCGDGPASFNAELTAAGGTVVSCDPLYRHSADEIRERIDETLPEMIDQTRRNSHTFVWTAEIPDVEALRLHRLETMTRFLADYETGQAEGRYVDAELPALPFADREFDIAICSHFLFLYSEQLSERFHIDAVRELARVAGEVRVFPLAELAAVPSRHLSIVCSTLRDEAINIQIEAVDYEFQRGANELMRGTHSE